MDCLEVVSELGKGTKVIMIKKIKCNNNYIKDLDKNNKKKNIIELIIIKFVKKYHKQKNIISFFRNDVFCYKTV